MRLSFSRVYYYKIYRRVKSKLDSKLPGKKREMADDEVKDSVMNGNKGHHKREKAQARDIIFGRHMSSLRLHGDPVT